MIVKKVFWTGLDNDNKRTRTWVGYFLFGLIPLYIRENVPGIN